MAANGFSCRLIAELTGVSKNTAAQIATAGVGTVEANQRLAKLLSQNLLLMAEEVNHRLTNGDGIKTSDLAVMIGIHAQHLPVLQGAPSQTVLVKHEHEGPAFTALIAELRGRMGLGAEIAQTKADLAAPVKGREIPVAVDMESPAFAAFEPVAPLFDTAFDAAQAGGEGVARTAAGPPPPMDMDEPKTQQIS